MDDEIMDDDLFETDEPAIADEPVEEEDTVDSLREKNAKLFARAKKAEGFVQDGSGNWVKRPKSEAPVQPIIQPAPSVDPEELRLIAKGLTDDEIDQAKAVARGKGVTLVEALKDPLFLSFQKDYKEEQRREKAKLGASKGSSQGYIETGIKPGMTTEEHTEVWKKLTGTN